jgi:DnaJ-domain-containing protein 1
MLRLPLMRPSHFLMFCRMAASLPRDHRLRAIPFGLSLEEAKLAYQRFHGENFLLAPMRDFEKTKEVFIPFFSFSGHVQVTARSARVGYLKMGVRYNPSTKQMENYPYYEYINVMLQERWAREYFATEPNLQIYAGSKYSSYDINVMKPGTYISAARQLDPQMMDERDGKEYQEVKGGERLRRLYPFTLAPADATNQALTWIHDQEEAVLQDLILSRHPGASKVQSIQFEISPASSFAAHPVFVPVIVFTTTSPWMKLKARTFVGAWGFNGQTMPAAGTRQYDELKVASLVGLISPLVLLMLGVAMPWTRLFWLGSIAPGIFAGTLARYSADARAWTLQVMRTEEDRLKQERAKTRGVLWEEDWVSALGSERSNSAGRRTSQGGGHRRGWQERQQSRDGQGSGGGRGASNEQRLQNHYQLLGVSPQASTAEIQAAFRAAALKNHPDLVRGEHEKKAASERFQRVHNAYSVLRDAEKRRAYDLTL